MHSEVEELLVELRAEVRNDGTLIAGPTDLNLRAASLIERLYQERDEAVALLAKVSRSLTSLTPGGSEYHSHSRDLDVYYADTEACERVIRDQFASGHKAKLEAVELRTALAEQSQ